MRSFILLGIAMFVCAAPAAAESLTMTTYYPAPSGKYQELQVTNMAQAGAFKPTSCLMLTYTENSGILRCPLSYPKTCSELNMPSTTSPGASGLLSCCKYDVDCSTFAE